jgi:hypothetical protein
MDSHLPLVASADGAPSMRVNLSVAAPVRCKRLRTSFRTCRTQTGQIMPLQMQEAWLITSDPTIRASPEQLSLTYLFPRAL